MLVLELDVCCKLNIQLLLYELSVMMVMKTLCPSCVLNIFPGCELVFVQLVDFFFHNFIMY
jgi:hypothetical protein